MAKDKPCKHLRLAFQFKGIADTEGDGATGEVVVEASDPHCADCGTVFYMSKFSAVRRDRGVLLISCLPGLPPGQTPDVKAMH